MIVDEELACAMSNLQVANEEMLEENHIVKLKSSDGKILEVDESVACKSPILRFVVEDMGTEGVIPTINVYSHTLAMVIKYCKYHMENDNITPQAVMDAWDEDFINVSQSTLHDLMLASDYLDIQNLSKLVDKAI